MTGKERGRRYGVEVLNKSSIVLITACWEAFVEDLATEAFDFLLSSATSYTDVPARVRVAASRPIRDAKDESKVWDLAGDGWRTVLQAHRDHAIQAFIGQFNTPKAAKIDELFLSLLGLSDLSHCWSWQKMSRLDAQARLDGFVNLRGDIAHRVAAARAVTKKDANDYRAFVGHLAVKSSNRVRTHLLTLQAKPAWDDIPF